MTLKQIKDFYKGFEIPPDRITLDDCSIVFDPELMVKTHIQILERNPGNKRFMNYYKRLVQVCLTHQNMKK